MSKVFLYRVKDTDDRDCCAYIEDTPLRFECGHYFGSVGLHGACYGNNHFDDYDEIETILTRQEYQELIDFSKAISELGYGISVGDERHKQGLNMCKDIQHVYDKLNSKQNEIFFEYIIKSEKEWVMDEYNFDEDEVDDVFDQYYGDYQDRGIIACVFKNTYECGYEEAYSCGYITRENKNIMEDYFDFEAFGEDLCEDEWFYELNSGRVVRYNY